MSGHPKEVRKSFSLLSFLQNRIRCFRNVLDKKIVLTELAEEILRYIRIHIFVIPDIDYRGVYSLIVAREKTTERTVASEKKINMFRNLNGVLPIEIWQFLGEGAMT